MSHINDMCRHDSDVSLSHSLEDMSYYVKDGRHFCVKWPPKWRIHWHDVFGNTFSGIYAPHSGVSRVGLKGGFQKSQI